METPSSPWLKCIFYLLVTVAIQFLLLWCVYTVCEPTGARKCTPDSTAPCCDSYGEFLTTAFGCDIPGTVLGEKILGYCNAGECASHRCTNDITTEEFCGASQTNPCKAACWLSGKCYDTAGFSDGGENLQDGAICWKNYQKGAFGLHACGINMGCSFGMVQIDHVLFALGVLICIC